MRRLNESSQLALVTSCRPVSKRKPNPANIARYWRNAKHQRGQR